MQKTAPLLLVLLVLGLIAWGFDALRTKNSGEEAERIFSYATTTLYIEEVPLVVEIADSLEKQGRGLGLREGLAPNTGMLFTFKKSGFHGFWMKDMQFSIDIAWLNEDFCIVSIAREVTPETYPAVYTPRAPARHVIEVSGGFFDSHNVHEGTCLTAPAL